MFKMPFISIWNFTFTELIILRLFDYWHISSSSILLADRMLHSVISAVGIIMLSFCPSVRLSVGKTMHCGSVGVLYRAKSCRHTSIRQLHICPFRHFCCRMYRLATICTEKNESKKNANAFEFFFETDNQACSVVVLRSVITDYVNYWTLVCHGHAWVDIVWVRS